MKINKLISSTDIGPPKTDQEKMAWQNRTKDIKFRVWDRVNSVFYYLDYQSISLVNGNRYVFNKKKGWLTLSFQNQFAPEVNEIHFQRDAFVVQRATGVPDSNWKEIYEGDTLSYNGRLGVVRYSAGAFRCEWPDGTDDDIGSMNIYEMKIIAPSKTDL